MRAEVHAPACRLDAFYSSPLGAVTRRVLRARMRAVWPELTGREVLGLGHAEPYLRLWRRGAARLVSATPRALPRPAPWPADGPCAAAQVEEERLPFADLSFDDVLLVHALEAAENARRMLRECWRVLRPEGRLLAVVPNRRSVWAHLERSPFGHGQPYTPGQLARLLEGATFLVEQRGSALYVPPLSLRPLLATASAWERVGASLAPQFGGVALVQARKSLAGLVPPAARAVRRPAAVLARARPAAARRAAQTAPAR